jgi:hypothetical protein
MRKLKVYHGTNAGFDRFDQSKARIPNDFWGGGVAYFTDDFGVAETYAASMKRSKGGDKIVYEVELRIDKMFDVDETFTGKELTKFFKKRDSEDFARGAGLLRLGADKYSVLDDLEEGRLVLTGSEIFYGLSKGMVYTAKARKRLEELGYDALRYNGGVNMSMAKKHNVYLTYKAANAAIKQRSIIDASGNVYKKAA